MCPKLSLSYIIYMGQVILLPILAPNTIYIDNEILLYDIIV